MYSSRSRWPKQAISLLLDCNRILDNDFSFHSVLWLYLRHQMCTCHCAISTLKPSHCYLLLPSASALGSGLETFTFKVSSSLLCRIMSNLLSSARARPWICAHTYISTIKISIGINIVQPFNFCRISNLFRYTIRIRNQNYPIESHTTFVLFFRDRTNFTTFDPGLFEDFKRFFIWVISTRNLSPIFGPF